MERFVNQMNEEALIEGYQLRCFGQKDNQSMLEKIPMEVIIEMALNIKNECIGYSEHVILNRLEQGKESQTVKENLERLAKANWWKIRRLAANELESVEGIVDMAIEEDQSGVIEVILERLQKEKNNPLMVSYLGSLLKAKDSRIRIFAASHVKLEITAIIERAVVEEDDAVSHKLIARLEQEQEIVIENLNRLAKAKSWMVRNFAVDKVTSEVVIEMAIVEPDDMVVDSILDRFIKENENECIKNSLERLSKAKYWRVRNFTVDKVELEAVFDMALVELDNRVVPDIIGRLEKEEKNTCFKNNIERLLNANSIFFQMFAIEKMDLNKVVQMAIVSESIDEKEEKERVIVAMVERLEKEKKHEIVKSNMEELSKAKSWRVRQFVAQNAKSDIIEEMAVEEENTEVICSIVYRLRRYIINGKLTTDSMIKLAKAKSWLVRQLAAEFVRLDVIISMAREEENEEVVKTISNRLEQELNDEMVKIYYKELLCAKSFQIINIVMNKIDFKTLFLVFEEIKNEKLVSFMKEDLINKFENECLDDLLKNVMKEYKKGDSVECFEQLLEKERQKMRNFILLCLEKLK